MLNGEMVCRFLVLTLAFALAALSANEPGEKARALLAQGKIQETLAELPALEKRAESDPEAKFALGEVLQELAALRATELARVAPNSAAAHELLGKSLEARGMTAEALAEYRAAVTKNPNTPGVHFLIGNANWKLRDVDAAQVALADELKLNPHHAMANLRMGEIVLDADRDHPMRAVEYLREAVDGDPSFLEAQRELGKALRLARLYSEAVTHLQFVAARSPNDDSVHAQLAAI